VEGVMSTKDNDKYRFLVKLLKN
jgi:hypothetical protein